MSEYWFRLEPVSSGMVCDVAQSVTFGTMGYAEPKPTSELGHLIVRTYKSRGESLTQFEARLGFGKGYLSKIISGKKNAPTGRNLVTLATALGTTADRILAGGPFENVVTAPAMQPTANAFDVAVPLALFDGALPEDVASARKHPDARDPRLTGREAYDLVMRAKRRREETYAATPDESSVPRTEGSIDQRIASKTVANATRARDNAEALIEELRATAAARNAAEKTSPKSVDKPKEAEVYVKKAKTLGSPNRP